MLAITLRMQKLEARYYPPFTRGRFIVVAHVFIPTDGDDRAPRIRPARAVSGRGSPASLLSTVRYLVRSTAPHTWQRLTALRSRYWTFAAVQLTAAERIGDISVVQEA